MCHFFIPNLPYSTRGCSNLQRRYANHQAAIKELTESEYGKRFLLADIDFEEEEQFVELNLPFLQHILKQPFEIIPIYMGHVFTSEDFDSSEEDPIHEDVDLF